MDSILVTGASRGLGLGLAKHYLAQGQQVFHLGRSACPLDSDNLKEQCCDLAELQDIPAALDALDPRQLDIVILNAGILGAIQDLSETPMDEARKLLDINLWANKAIVDWLAQNGRLPRLLVFISSGASINGHRGWGAYSISKAALNMMAKLYAAELPDTHVVAYAPGLVHTGMQEYLCHQVDAQRYPSIERLVQAYGSDDMPSPEQAAERIAASFERCFDHPSGSFVDVRKL